MDPDLLRSSTTSMANFSKQKKYGPGSNRLGGQSDLGPY